MPEKQLAFDFDAHQSPDAPIITFDLNSAYACLEGVSTYGKMQAYREAYAYALKLRQAADSLAKELEQFIY